MRNVDYDNMQLRDGVRIFVAEAYNPLDAPPAYIDPVLQGAALNAKPPKPPRYDYSSLLFRIYSVQAFCPHKHCFNMDKPASMCHHVL